MKPKIEALLKQIHSGKRMSDNARILDYIMKHPFTTTSEVEIKLNMLHQTASARISDLLDIGVIEEKGKKESARSSFTYLKYQPNPSKQIENALKRKKEKYSHWLKKGLTHFKEFINPSLEQQLKHESTI